MPIRVGTCGWTDPTLIESNAFYPSRKMTAEERLKFYAAGFDTVEVDSTYYALPSEKVVGLQTLRTPDNFVIHYKAFGLLTRHSIDARRLPKAIKGMLPEEMACRSVLSYRDVPPEATELAWRMFDSALLPAESAGKLGIVLFQFPPSFVFSEEHKDYIRLCKDRLSHYRLAVEFRHPSWVSPANLDDTLSFLKNFNLVFVCVDAPQFHTRATLPPMAVATSDIGYIRLHGRNAGAWFKKNISAAERFAYDYSDRELSEWIDSVQRISYYTSETFVMFNNCFRNYAVKNAARMAQMLAPS